MDLVCLGELLLDMFPAKMGSGLTEQPAWYPKPGGAPANVAVAAARLQMLSAFIGKVGDDLFGRYLAEVLRQNRVDVRGLRFDARARTTLAFHAKPNPHTAEFLFYRNPGADMLLEPGDLDIDLLKSTRALHIGSITLIQEPSRSATFEATRIACAAGALISFDVNYRQTLWENAGQARSQILAMVPNANLLKVNEAEIELLAGGQDIETAAASLRALGPELVIVTLGPAGSYFCTAHGGQFIPAFAVETVDAVGCGDAFVAGLLSRLLSHPDGWRRQLESRLLAESLRFANAVGALTALKPGVIPALPTLDEVNRFIEQSR